MAELSKDTQLIMTFDSVDATERRMVEKLLAATDEVSAFRFGDDGTLAVSIRSAEGEADLVRALTAAGIYPRSTHELGSFSAGGPHAC